MRKILIIKNPRQHISHEQMGDLFALYGAIKTTPVGQEYEVEFANEANAAALLHDVETHELAFYLASNRVTLKITIEEKKQEELPKGSVPKVGFTSKVDPIKQYDDHYDDSSDDEEVEKKIAAYDLGLQYKKYIEEQKINIPPVALQNHASLSFLAHALGIEDFYSQDVNKLYYPLKRHSLASRQGLPSVKLHELLNEAVAKSVQDSLAHLQEHFIKFTGVTLTINGGELLKIAQQLVQDRLGSFINYNRNLDQDVITIPSFVSGVNSKLLSCIRHPLLSNVDWHRAQQTLIHKAREYFCSLLLPYSDQKYTTGRDDTVKALRSWENYRSVNLLIRILSSAVLNTMVPKMIEPYLNQQHSKEEILQAYLADITTGLITIDKNLYNSYFSCCQDSIIVNFRNIFTNHFTWNLRDRIKLVRRDTLGRDFLFTSNGHTLFNANLRLANRSQKRLRWNLKYDFFPYEEVSRRWLLSPLLSKDQAALESQEISANEENQGRSDKVKNLGSYKKVFAIITTVKNILQVTDADIAVYIRTLLQGQIPKINCASEVNLNRVFVKLNEVAYLLFGCEAVRNPGVRILNQMVLDLIIGGLWTWEIACLGGRIDGFRFCMPMAAKGAVPVGRKWETEIRKYMPYPYSYEGNEKKRTDKKSAEKPISKEDLLWFEAKVILDWLELKKITHLYPKYIELSKHIKIPYYRFLSWIAILIKGYYPSWFGTTSVQFPSNKAEHNWDEKRLHALAEDIRSLPEFKHGVGGLDEKSLTDTFYTNPNTCFMNSSQRQLILLCEARQCNLPYTFLPAESTALAALEFEKGIVLLPEIDTREGYVKAAEQLKTIVKLYANKNKVITICINLAGHYSTLALTPTEGGNWGYRYIDPLHDGSGDLAGPDLSLFKTALQELIPAIICLNQDYKRQQHLAGNIVFPHHNECGFHNVFNTLHMLKVGVNADFQQMKVTLNLGGPNLSGNNGLDPYDALHFHMPRYQQLCSKLLTVIVEQKSSFTLGSSR